MKKISRLWLMLAALALSLSPILCADEVLDWNAIVMRTLAAANVGGAPAFRPTAIVHVAMFDAVNGIHRKYTPFHVTDKAPKGASRRAAAVQAAYTALAGLFPGQSGTLSQDLEASLAAIAAHGEDGNENDDENGESIALGRQWGEKVANLILAWRSMDGFNPPAPTYLGSNLPGKWRPTPPAFAPGLVPSLAHTLPWVIPDPWSFRPSRPLALTITSPEYTADFKEVKAVGELTSTLRTADQTEAARFWAATALTFWNRTAVSNLIRTHKSLSDKARLLALLNAAMSDGAISCWDAKYFFEFWRPITAIRFASTDGNPDTVEQADWTPLIVTPPYPEYTSGHATVSGAAQAVLTIYFGPDVPVEGTSEGLPGVVRTWPSFAAAADEANLARVWGGIHYRTAVHDGRAAGNAIGAFVTAHAAQKLHGDDAEE